MFNVALSLVLLVLSVLVAAPVVAFAGVFTVLLAVIATAWRDGLSPDRLALVGVGAAALTAAVVDLLVVSSRLRFAPALVWLSGSTYARDLDDVRRLAPCRLP